MTVHSSSSRRQAAEQAVVDGPAAVYPRIVPGGRRRDPAVPVARPARRSRRFRLGWTFGLKTLLIFVLLVSLPLGWLAWRLENERDQRAAAHFVEEAGGAAYFEHQKELSGNYGMIYNANARWNPLEDEFFIKIEIVGLDDTNFADAELKHLECCRGLKALSLMNTPITDAGLRQIAPMSSLRIVNLCGTYVTRGGVRRLTQALPDCTIYWDGDLGDSAEPVD